MLLLVFVLNNAKPINLIFYCSIPLLSSISWKRWVRTTSSSNVTIDVILVVYCFLTAFSFLANLLPYTGVDWGLGDFVSVQLVSSPSGLKLLPSWLSHPSLSSHPSFYWPNHRHCYLHCGHSHQCSHLIHSQLILIDCCITCICFRQSRPFI